MSTTRSQRVNATAAQNGGQCSRYGSLSSTIVRSRLGMRANTSSATGPQATVTRASGWARIRWSSRPVDSTASPSRLEVTNRMRIRMGLAGGRTLRERVGLGLQWDAVGWQWRGRSSARRATRLTGRSHEGVPRMAEAKLAPNLPGWMVEHANRYLSSGGSDGHMYKMTQPGRPEITVPSLLLTTTGRKSGEKFIFPLFYGETRARQELFRGGLERRRATAPRLVSQHPRQSRGRGSGRDTEDEGAGEDRDRRGTQRDCGRRRWSSGHLTPNTRRRPSGRYRSSCWSPWTTVSVSQVSLREAK